MKTAFEKDIWLAIPLTKNIVFIKKKHYTVITFFLDSYLWWFTIKTKSDCLSLMHFDQMPSHCVNHCNLTKFSGVEVLPKRTAFAEILSNDRKLYRNFAFPQKFNIRWLEEILVIYAVPRLFQWFLLFWNKCLRVMKKNENWVIIRSS